MFSVTYLNHHLQKLLSVNLLDPDYYRDQDQTNWEYCNIIEIKMRLGKWLKTHKKYINNNNDNNNNLITISYQQSIDNNTKLLSKFTLRKFRCLMLITSFLVQSLSNFQMTIESNYALLRLVIGLKDSRQFFNQRESKPKPIAPCTCGFSRALSELQVIARNCDWLIALPAPAVIGRSNCFGFGFSTVI